MAILVQSILDSARDTLNDDAKIRYTDEKALQYFNDGMHELAIMRPDLFTQIGDIPCTQGTCDQTLPAGGMFVVDIYSIKGGAAVDFCELDTLRAFRPTWRTDPAAPAQNWLRRPQDPSKQNNPVFMIYPQAPPNQTLTGEFPIAPARVLAANLDSALLPISDPYQVPLQAYVIYRAESKDDEHVLAQRAAAFRGVFEELVMVAAKTEQTAP
jgi:hypothetical protein